MVVATAGVMEVVELVVERAVATAEEMVGEARAVVEREGGKVEAATAEVMEEHRSRHQRSSARRVELRLGDTRNLEYFRPEQPRGSQPVHSHVRTLPMPRPSLSRVHSPSPLQYRALLWYRVGRRIHCNEPGLHSKSHC